ncbi:hypothetical protein ATCC90586_000735 [Pythium insidiosum]|nr:hypothetical protein ATCC90586_000735 [Pythium insidiosum]
METTETRDDDDSALMEADAAADSPSASPDDDPAPSLTPRQLEASGQDDVEISGDPELAAPVPEQSDVAPASSSPPNADGTSSGGGIEAAEPIAPVTPNVEEPAAPQATLRPWFSDADPNDKAGPFVLLLLDEFCRRHGLDGTAQTLQRELQAMQVAFPSPDLWYEMYTQLQSVLRSQQRSPRTTSPFPPDGLRTERYTIPKESKYSPDVHQLIARMLQADVERRASMAHVLECIDELLAGRALPKSSGGAPSPKKAAAPQPAAERRTNSGTKTAEARKETVAAPKPASDLLDMDFNPTISTPAPVAAATKTVDPFNAAWGSSAPATAAAPTGGFADFANFPSSPRAFGAATAPTPSSFDAFGFPASPVKAQGMQPTAGMAQPAFGFAPPAPQAFGAPPPPAPPAAPVDPFEGLGGLGPAAMPTTGPRPMYPGQQGFQPMGQPQQAILV